MKKQSLMMASVLLIAVPGFSAPLLKMYNTNEGAYVATNSGVQVSIEQLKRKKNSSDKKSVKEDSEGYAYVDGDCHGVVRRYCDQKYLTVDKARVAFDTFKLGELVLPATGKALESNTKQTLNFISVGDGGTELGTEFRYTNATFSKIFISGQGLLKVRQMWKLATCDGQRMEYREGGDLRSAIEALRRFDFTRYMSCELKPASGDYYDTRAVCSEQGVSCEGAKKLTLRDNGDIEVGDGRSYYKMAKPVDSRSEDEVEAATQELIRLFKSYSNLLLILADAKQADKSTATNDWIGKNKGAIVKSLQIVEKNLNSISSLSKLNAVTSINRAYSYLNVIEQNSRGSLVLDEVIQTGR